MLDPLENYRLYMSKSLVVIGGGAAGFFTALNAKIKRPDLKITVLEATARLLTKVKISGVVAVMLHMMNLILKNLL